MRQFTCAHYDKPWFYDRSMWPAYLSMLADQRFNRLHLAFGLGYDSLAHVADSYFLFTYPFLLECRGMTCGSAGWPTPNARATWTRSALSAEQTVAHGLEFQLGLWMHGYDGRPPPVRRWSKA